MISDVELKVTGVQILDKYRGHEEAKRFIALIQQEPFDYTKWHQQRDDEMNIEEISCRAMSLRIKSRYSEQ